MSLDVSLIRKVYLSYDEGKTYTEQQDELYWANITHNLGLMAEKSGLYDCLWRPDENGFEKAADIIAPLEKGIALLKEKPAYFKTFDASNGWGVYEHFVPFVEKYLEACIENPEAIIKVSR